ncbi:MAG: ABC transporter permease [Lachnospiraceae bacterium]|nr:ABC transporter permease [Lachnospiraceae bacterium]
MKKIFKEQKFIVLLVAIALYIIFALISKDFRKYTTIILMLDTTYYFVLLGIGVTFPLITGGVDLSIGTGMVCYALVGGFLIRDHKWPVIAAMLFCVLFGLLVGCVNGVLVAIMDLPPFLATLCTCMITRGLGTRIANQQAVPWPTAKVAEGWFHNLFKLSINKVKYPTGIIVVIVFVVIMAFVLNHTRMGRYTIAIGSNKEATRLSGVNVKAYHIAAYAICGLFAGLASIGYAAATPTVQPGTGAGLELDAIGGAIVGGVSAAGGVGSIEGTLIGVLVIQLLKTGLPFIGLEANWQQIIMGLVLIGAVIIDVIKQRRAAAM